MGQGTHCLNREVYATWAYFKRIYHINFLKLLAKSKALRVFENMILGEIVQATMDKTTAMCYVNRREGNELAFFICQSYGNGVS